ncbi:MAG TPA: glycosyltransferase [Candidatus Limnocylindrales bacterium]|nr:glycosyltransferase [Candidatus Limnocylindrales bacterium]
MTATGALGAQAAPAVPDERHREPVAHRPAVEPAAVVAYVMSRFPKLSETFVINEILAVERAGVRVEVHPLIREAAALVQPAARPLVARARFLPVLSWPILAALAHYLWRRPGALIGSLSALIADTWRQPGRLMRSVVLFPKIVGHVRLIEAEGVEHVHCHFATYPAFAGYVINRLTGIPFSFTAHAHDIQIDETMLARKVEAAAFVVAISEFNRNRIVEVCGTAAAAKVRVIHCGVDATRFAPAGPRDAGTGLPLIVSVGRLIPLKGHLELIQACARLAGAGVRFRCRIVGDGPFRDVLERQIVARGLTGTVALTGPKTADDVRDLLRETDVFVTPSIPMKGRMEGIPVVLMEALSSGVPVVASRMSGIPELVVDGENGVLVEPGDVPALAEALRGLVSDPERRARFGRAGRERVLASFELDKEASALVAAFEATIEARRQLHARAGEAIAAG